MQNIIKELITFLREFYALNSAATKEQLAEAAKIQFNLVKTRSVYHNKEVVLRFSIARMNNFSNVILSLATLKIYDDRPFIVCILRSTHLDFLLANTTFLKKISHSSHHLREDNIKGSFLGHDIMRIYDNIANTPDNFEILFDIHTGFTWEENLKRLVENTTNIAPTGKRFEASDDDMKKILAAPQLAATTITKSEYIALHQDLSSKLQNKHHEILEASKILNVKEHGDKIEEIITNLGSYHKLEDLEHIFQDGIVLKIDIKTKLLTHSSNPKGYNIDKFLKALADGKTVYAFYFVGINPDEEKIFTRLISVFDETILASTRIQYHWAGRNSRGVTQLSGFVDTIFAEDYLEKINLEEAVAFLLNLINLKAQQD